MDGKWYYIDAGNEERFLTKLNFFEQGGAKMAKQIILGSGLSDGAYLIREYELRVYWSAAKNKKILGFAPKKYDLLNGADNPEALKIALIQGGYLTEEEYARRGEGQCACGAEELILEYA